MLFKIYLLPKGIPGAFYDNIKSLCQGIERSDVILTHVWFWACPVLVLFSSPILHIIMKQRQDIEDTTKKCKTFYSYFDWKLGHYSSSCLCFENKACFQNTKKGILIAKTCIFKWKYSGFFFKTSHFALYFSLDFKSRLDPDGKALIKFDVATAEPIRNDKGRCTIVKPGEELILIVGDDFDVQNVPNLDFENNVLGWTYEHCCAGPLAMAAPRRSCSSFVGEEEILIGYYVMKVLNHVWLSKVFLLMYPV